MNIKKLMIVAPGPRFSTYDIYRYYVEAFKKMNIDVSMFNFHDWYAFYTAALAHIKDEQMESEEIQGEGLRLGSLMLLSSLARALPDAVLCISGIAVPTTVWKWVREFVDNLKKDILLTTLFTESPYIDDWQLRIMELMDAGFVMDLNSVDTFSRLGKPVEYIPHAYNPSVHYPREFDPRFSADVFMVGTGFPERRALVDSIDWTGVDLRLFGDWEVAGQEVGGTTIEGFVSQRYLDNETEVPHWYSSSRVSLNVFRTARWPGDVIEHISDIEAYSASPRCFEAMACGGLLMTNARPELFDLFEEGRDFVVFDSAEELQDLVHFYTENERDARTIKKSAIEAVKGHTYDDRAKFMMSFMRDL